MADKKNWGKTVLGWFVVTDEANDTSATEPAADTESTGGGDVDALIRKYAGGGGAEATAAATDLPVKPQGPLPALAEAEVDLQKVFEAFGVDAEERDRVNRARELLRALPQETPAPIKKQIVEASLRSFGIPTEKIIEAAAEELQALEMFIRQGQAEAQGVLSEGAQRIQALEAEIAAVRRSMEDAVAAQTGRTQACNAEKLRVQEVLEFFGQEAVARVVEQSPKLQSPPAR